MILKPVETGEWHGEQEGFVGCCSGTWCKPGFGILEPLKLTVNIKNTAKEQNRILNKTNNENTATDQSYFAYLGWSVFVYCLPS